jgi:Tfp pilus assembly protein PilZ
MPTQQDHRVYHRFTARFPAKIKDSRDDYGTKVFLRDASAEGFRLTAKEKFFINDSLSLSVNLPDGHEPLVLNGQIVWVKTQEPGQMWEIGLRFHKIKLMNIQRLFRFIGNETP